MVEAPEVPHHHHAKTGLPWFDMLVPVAVICISVAALLTSLQSEKSMHALVDENRRLVEAQSTPLLMLDNYNLNDAGKAAIGFSLTNVGTGPARIAWFHLADDKGVSYAGGELYERVKKEDPHATFTSQVISGSLMRSGEKREVFEWPKPADGSPVLGEWATLNDTRFGLHGSACYCSMFDECRVTDFGEKKPRVVESCEAAGK
jgi:hypothetical protein